MVSAMNSDMGVVSLDMSRTLYGFWVSRAAAAHKTVLLSVNC